MRVRSESFHRAALEDSPSLATGRLSARRVTEELVTAAAWRGERIISLCRSAFCIAVLARFIIVGRGVPWPGVVLNVSVILSAIAFSLWILQRIHSGRLAPRSLSLSVTVDACVCFCSLLQTSLWPNVEQSAYTGLLARPDPSALFLVVIGAGFRLSPGLSLLGSVLSCGAFTALVLVERVRHSESLAYGVFDVAFFAVVLLGMAALSFVLARQTRSLVESGALTSFKVDRTRKNLARMVREHHDAKSVLSAALLDAERVSSALKSSDRVAHDSAELASRLARELGEVSAAVRVLSEDAMEQMTGLDDVVPVDVGAALPAIVDALRYRFPALDIQLDLGERGCVRLAGGRPSLERMLYNLIANALEGDGARGAAAITVSTFRDGARLLLRVDDDGPGFRRALLESSPNSTTISTKPNGSGFGLHGVAELLEMSGGSIRRTNRGVSGARVELEFRVV